ncbi:MAG: hypothetical protein DME12_18530 [Candidatus Rokuibacteriota bacterium]|nr:MAG: hypothetical protein DME12_18530 [Candidatus Rokubacteria bacterium]
MQAEECPADRAVETVREVSEPPRPEFPRPRARVPSHDQFSLLIVRGDGTKVVRFNFTRPVARGAFAALALAVSVVGTLATDWVQLRELTREARTFARQIAEQHATIDSFNRRVVDLRQEIVGWRELHARIWEPFGPELTPGARDKGIGGGGVKVAARIAPGDEIAGRIAVGAELERLAESVKEQGDNLRALDRLMARAGKALAALPSRWPVRGGVNSEFGNRLSPWTRVTEFHSGLDINAQPRTPVRAPAGGTVFFAGTQPEYGVTVIVDHGQEIRSLYGHLSQALVKHGERVERGQVIAYSGNTGRSSGPHLHYEILVKGHSVNPRAYLWD